MVFMGFLAGTIYEMRKYIIIWECSTKLQKHGLKS